MPRWRSAPPPCSARAGKRRTSCRRRSSRRTPPWTASAPGRRSAPGCCASSPTRPATCTAPPAGARRGNAGRGSSPSRCSSPGPTTPPTRCCRRSGRSALVQGLARLSPEHRQVVTCRYLLDLDEAETADGPRLAARDGEVAPAPRRWPGCGTCWTPRPSRDRTTEVTAWLRTRDDDLVRDLAALGRGIDLPAPSGGPHDRGDGARRGAADARPAGQRVDPWWRQAGSGVADGVATRRRRVALVVARGRCSRCWRRRPVRAAVADWFGFGGVLVETGGPGRTPLRRRPR